MLSRAEVPKKSQFHEKWEHFVMIQLNSASMTNDRGMVKVKRSTCGLSFLTLSR